MRLKRWCKNISEKYPFLGRLIVILYLFLYKNKVKKKICGDKNQINYKNVRLSKVIFDINGYGNIIEIKEGSILKNVTFFIRGNNHRILIGSNCIFNRGGNIWIEDSECVLSIGDNSTFEEVHLALTEPGSKITIGCDCMFAYDIDVRTGDSHSVILEENNVRINFAEDIKIGDHVWIAAHTILLKGTIISENSIVATGSVVSGKHETKGTIIGGNPARQLKQGISWSRERIYNRLSEGAI